MRDRTRQRRGPRRLRSAPRAPPDTIIIHSYDNITCNANTTTNNNATYNNNNTGNHNACIHNTCIYIYIYIYTHIHNV